MRALNAMSPRRVRAGPWGDARLVGHRQEDPGRHAKRQQAQNPEYTPPAKRGQHRLDGRRGERTAERADRRRDAGHVRDPAAFEPIGVRLDERHQTGRDPDAEDDPRHDEPGKARRQRERRETDRREHHQHGLYASRAKRVERDAQRQLRGGIGGEQAGGQHAQLDGGQPELHGEHGADDRHHHTRRLVHDVCRGQRQGHPDQHAGEHSRLQASLDSTPSRKRCMLSIVPCRVCAAP